MRTADAGQDNTCPSIFTVKAVDWHQ